jgi:hypothetical protein
MSITVGTVSEEHSDYPRASSSPSGLPADRAIPLPCGALIHEAETLPETAPLP